MLKRKSKLKIFSIKIGDNLVFINFFLIFVSNTKFIIMNMDTKVNFNVKALGFPTGKIYKMYIWLEGNYQNAGKYIDDHVDEIKDQIKEI